MFMIADAWTMMILTGHYMLRAQTREENAKRQHDGAAAQLRTASDHRATMDALLQPEGVPPDFLAPCPDAGEAASLAQQPWYRVLYIAQVCDMASAVACPACMLGTCCGHASL